MTTPTIILDSSVIAKWFFSEADSDKALRIKDKFTQGTLAIAAPLLLYYEVNNILKTATKLFRINPLAVRDVYEHFLHLNVITYSTVILMTSTLEIALQYDISSYDASYIALAEYLRIPFVTADKKLLQKATSTYIHALEEYS